MNRHNGSGLWCHHSSYLLRIDEELVRVDVDQDWHGTDPRDGLGCGNECISGDDDLVSGLDAHGSQSEFECIGAVGHADRLGHVQVADAPGRHQPGTGTVDVAGCLAALEDVGYDGWVGLEYAPLGPSTESFGWLAR